ncbi:MAG TPA: nucleotide exchange factor GrpE [Steroidobacteraceae bacterium]|nr:nucleotide exchange factor GrpE [Steroidobacteraceae bacterium]
MAVVEPTEPPMDQDETRTAAAADATEVADAEVAALRTALAAAEQASAAARDAQLRALAELENVRKRAQRDIENAQRYALERFAAELLAVRDSLELAVQNAGTADARSLAEGQQATLQLLARAFERFSILRLDPGGQNFDPTLHEAVIAQESADAAPGTVLQVLQSGYQLNGRLLRPARVIVARAPAAPPSTDGGGT